MIPPSRRTDAEQVTAGSFLLLLPEDVHEEVSMPSYATITRARRTAVEVQLLCKTDDSTEGSVLSIPRAVADSRRVPTEEATGQRPGAWLRRAIRFEQRGYLYYGQVVDYAGAALAVATHFGRKTVPQTCVSDEVYPVVAMSLGGRRWSKATWSTRRLHELEDAVFSRLMDGDEGAPWSVRDWLCEWSHLLGDLSETRYEWVDPTTGVKADTSLTHVAQFAFYVDGRRTLPATLRHALGPSFCRDPRASTTPASQRPTVSLPDAAASEPGFFDPLEDDDSDAGSVTPGPTVTSGRPRPTTSLAWERGHEVVSTTQAYAEAAQVPATRTPHLRAPAGTMAPAEQEIELIDLIRQHKPHLLSHYLSLGSSHVPPKRGRDDLEAIDAAPPSKRGRGSFQPTIDQERVHQLLTADHLQGKPCDFFFEYVLASPAVQFDTHPGTIGRLYDLRFGRGLSISHFRRVSFLEKLRNGGHDMSDFSTAAPAAPVPGSWAELGSTTRSFVDFSRAMCDATTIAVAEALDQLVTALEGWQQCEIADLPLVVRWIDSLLERYRNATMHDTFHSTTTRRDATSWFSISNPELHSLMITALGERLRLSEARVASQRSTSSREATRSSFERKIPSEISAEIPTQDGKEVCLHFLSKRGCKSSDPAKCTFKNRAHFWPEALPARLRQYITTRLGGLRKSFQEA